jgi:hypothetical protein
MDPPIGAQIAHVQCLNGHTEPVEPLAQPEPRQHP